MSATLLLALARITSLEDIINISKDEERRTDTRTRELELVARVHETSCVPAK